MRNYKEIFDQAKTLAQNLENEELREAIRDWRNHPELFHFVMANDQLLSPDPAALYSARIINPSFYSFMLKKGPYRNTGKMDAVECRHILLLSFLGKHLGKNWGKVLEIGGGYGNFLRLVEGYITYIEWNITDLNFILKLQGFVHGELGIHGIFYRTFIEPAPYDLAIATHSLSEFDKDTFDQYLDDIKDTKYLFYARHSSQPSREILEYKWGKITELFDEVAHLNYESDNSIMTLLQNKHLLVG